MASDGFIVLDEHRSVFNLFLLIISDKTHLNKSDHYDRDCLLAISTDEKLRLEDAKLVLYLFYLHCNNLIKEATLENYLIITERTMKNVDSIRRSIKRLGALKITYLDHNGKRQNENLFKYCELQRGKIVYQINGFFESKLNKRGRGHRNRGLYDFIFKEDTYRTYTQNTIRLLVMVNLIYSLNDVDMIDEKILNQEKRNIKVLLNKYFDNLNPLFSRWIDHSCDVFLNEYNNPSQS